MSNIANIDEKPTIADSTSSTLKSASSIFVTEKAVGEGEADDSTVRGSTANTDSIKEEKGEKEPSVREDVLTKINTSQEGVEYPTGVKLGLISLALCLSVFLIALVSWHS